MPDSAPVFHKSQSVSRLGRDDVDWLLREHLQRLLKMVASFNSM
jgi:hypothetical protein